MTVSLKVSSLSSFTAQIIQFAMGFILTPFIIKHLGNDYFGLWVFFSTILSFDGLLTFGTIQSLYRYVPYFLGKTDTDSLEHFVKSHLIIYLIIGSLIALSLWGLKDLIFHFFNMPDKMYQDFIESFPYILIAFLISILSKVYISIVIGHEKFVAYNTITVVTQITRFILVFVFIHKGFSSLVIALIVSQAIQLLLCWLQSERLFKLQLREWDLDKSKTLMKTSLTFGLGGVLMYAADILRHQVDYYILAKYLNLDSVSFYKVGDTLLSSIKMIVVSLFGVTLTRFSFNSGENDLTKIKAMTKRMFFISSTISSFFVIGVILMAPSFLKLWIGEYSPKSLELIYLLAIPQFIMMTQFPSINIMYAMNKHHLLGKITFIESLINFSISIVLIQKLGFIGVIIGTCVGFILSKAITIPMIMSSLLNYKVLEQIKNITPSVVLGYITYLIFTRIIIIPNELNIIYFSLYCTSITLVFFGLYNILFSMMKFENADLFLIRNYLGKK